MRPTYHIKAIQYGEKILVFGGYFDEDKYRYPFMMIIDKDGKKYK